MKTLMMVAVGLALTACGQIREARTARDIDRCSGYGFQPGTVEFAQCRMKMDEMRAKASGGNSACSLSGNTLICY